MDKQLEISKTIMEQFRDVPQDHFDKSSRANKLDLMNVFQNNFR